MRILPSEKTVQRAEARLARRFLALMGIATLVFGFVVAVHYLFGGW